MKKVYNLGARSYFNCLLAVVWLLVFCASSLQCHVCECGISWSYLLFFICSIYRSTLQCQTCLSLIHSICRIDHPFPRISPILLCISNLFMSNSVTTKSQLYGSGFSFQKISFCFFTTTCVEVKFVLVKKLNNKKVKLSN